MHILTILILLISFSNSYAFVIWPNASSRCNGTLQACVDGSPNGEFIEIRTNKSIDEDISTTKPISLVAGIGYHPIFASSRDIDIRTNSPNNHTINIIGLTFIGGRISYIHRGEGNATLNIKNNSMPGSFIKSAISLQLYSTAVMTVNIEYNVVSRTNSIQDGSRAGTIYINKAVLSNGGKINGRIYNNTITAIGDLSVGLGIFDSTQGNIELAINANEFYGGGWGAITVRKQDASGIMEIDAISNAFYTARNDLPFFRGIRINAQTGVVKFTGINNTMLGADTAIMLIDSLSSTLTSKLYNNIMAFGKYAVNSNTMAINNDYNLTFQNQLTDTDFVPGANHIYSNPHVKSMRNGRLRKNSPAVDAGNMFIYTTLFNGAKIDSDGSLRTKKGSDIGGNDKIDIGAYEYGDLSFTHINTTNGSYISRINHSSLNNIPNLDSLHVTSNWNPPNSFGIYNPDNEALYNASGRWHVFNEDFLQIPLGAAFNITKFASSGNTFEHTASSSSSTSTTLNNAGINGHPDKILQVSQHWKGTYNSHPIGIAYAVNWIILNFDLQNIPAGSSFNVYSQDPSKSAWIHNASVANVSGSSTFLSNPLLDGVACANVQITRKTIFGVSNISPIGVWFNGSKWLIFNQDASPMPINAAFHVVINPEQIADCSDLIFKNGYE